MINSLKKNEIITERLRLAPLGDASGDEIIRIMKDESVRRTYMVPLLETREAEAKLFSSLKNATLSDVRIAYGVYFGGEAVGFLNDVGFEDGSIEIGYVISPKYQNRGFCTEALKAVIAELFRIGFSTVKAGYFEENIPSRRVMEKCGMKETSETEEIEYMGIVHKCKYMAIEKE
ncbi:MAG: GNAT family N-acetyltransferase [Clostridia bacterium]|nr:GNAT family N-acetyltransferase [Clostridia bacterium]